MIVPEYWAESRVQHREHGRQVTLRRFGWSDTSPAAAQAHADERAQEALRRVLAGEPLRRREPKVPYNGAEGVPIREEIVSRQGTAVITRNSYGALCLNTPNVLFADIDFATRPSCRLLTVCAALAMVGALAIGVKMWSMPIAMFLLVIAPFLGGLVGRALFESRTRLAGGTEAMARRHVTRFVERQPEWSVRLYRTPAGLRALVTHRTFLPGDPEVSACFTALVTDPIYVRMCTRQRCFRARVSPKPWRIGIAMHMRPRPGVWPVASEKLAIRAEWIARYESAAEGFAACAFLETLGSGVNHQDVRPVQELHDSLCRAHSQLPLA